MGVEYREWTPEDGVEACLDLQREVFGYTDTELVSPLVFRMIARNNPPVGLVACAWHREAGGEESLAGMMLGFASFEPGTIYAASLGVRTRWRDSPVGFRLMHYFRERSLARGLVRLRGINEPLDQGLARFFYGGIGYRATEYLVDASDAEVPQDKLVHHWDFSVRGGGTGGRDELGDAPLARPDRMPWVSPVRVAIPADFPVLCRDDPPQARILRLENRIIMDEYVNSRGYAVTGCITDKAAEGRRSCYILEAGS